MMKNKLNKLPKLILISLFILSIFPALNSYAGAPIVITEDTVLDMNISVDVTPIIIGANNLTLDCRGFTLDADFVGNGIFITNRRNITIKNCVFTGISGDAVGVRNSSGINILGCESHNNVGIRFNKVSNSYVKGNDFSSAGFPLVLENNSNSNYFIDNDFSGAAFGDGIIMTRSNANHFINNLANGSSSADGLHCNDSQNNTFKNNQFNSNNIEGADLHECNNNTFINNQFNNNGSDGFQIDIRSQANLIFYNTANSNGADGFEADPGSSANIFKHNFASGNSDFSFQDDTTGNRTAGTANTYEHNECPSDSPNKTGLCDTTP